MCAIVLGAGIRWLPARLDFPVREWIPCKPLLVDPLRAFLSLAIAATYGWLILPLTRSPLVELLDLGCALLGGWMIAGGLGTWIASWLWRLFPSAEMRLLAPSTLNVRSGARERSFNLGACTVRALRVTTLVKHGNPWFIRYTLENNEGEFTFHVQDTPEFGELLDNPEVKVSWIGPAVCEQGPQVMAFLTSYVQPAKP